MLLEKVYQYTGSSKDFVVPNGVTSIRFECYGATGGISWAAGTPSHFTPYYWETSSQAKANGGQGSNAVGYVAGTLAVTPGDVYHLYVGGNGKSASYYVVGQVSPGTTVNGGAGGFNGGGAGGKGRVDTSGYWSGSGGGGGGGATDIRSGDGTLAERIMVAGGAGGGGGKTFYNLTDWVATANPNTPIPPYSSPKGSTPVGYYLSAGHSTGGYGGTTGRAGGAGYRSGGGGGATHSAGGAGGSSTPGHPGAAGTSGQGGAGGSVNALTNGDGGGGGGGGYFGGGGGGGGGDGSFDGAAGGGGGSNHIDAAFTDQVNLSHAIGPVDRNWEWSTGYGGVICATYRQPPNPPVFVFPGDDSFSATGTDVDITVIFGFEFNSGGLQLARGPDGVALTSDIFSSWELRYRVSPAGAWTTISDLPVGSSGVVGDYTIPGGTLALGNTYDIEARVIDIQGDWSDWSSIQITVVAPPPPPVITAPVSPENSASFDVTWTQASGDTQSNYQVQFLNPSGTIVYDSGVVASTVQSHHVDWALASDFYTLQVRYTTVDPDLWSDWTSEPMEVNIDPPGVPLVTGMVDNTRGSVMFTITAVDVPFPTTTLDVYRTDLTHDEDEIRVVSGLVPDPGTRVVEWTDYTPANQTHYRYRVRANSAAGGFADV